MTDFRYTIKKDDEGVPIKGLLRREFNFSSRLLTKLKFQNLVFLNNEPISGWTKTKEGDDLLVKLPDEKSNFPIEDIPISPIYEDEHLLLINKQAGITVHPTKGHPNHTIANGMMKYMKETNQEFKIRFVNRLDMDTTGILIIAKNSHAQDSLMKQMQNNKTEKRYIAIVNGIVEKDKFTIDLPIGKPDPDKVAREVMPVGGMPSVTHVTVLERFTKDKGYTMVELLLGTGRTHQIRVHMTHIGHPLVGDYLYGGDNPWLIDRQALHAYKLSFNHPITGARITAEAPLPDDINKVLEKVR